MVDSLAIEQSWLALRALRLQEHWRSSFVKDYNHHLQQMENPGLDSVGLDDEQKYHIYCKGMQSRNMVSDTGPQRKVEVTAFVRGPK